MIKDTLTKIEQQLKTADLSEEKRADLLNLANTLKEELSALEKLNQSKAGSIANFTQASTHEHLKTDKNQNLLDLSSQALEQSVVEFENSHPRLVQTVRAIGEALGNMGI